MMTVKNLNPKIFSEAVKNNTILNNLTEDKLTEKTNFEDVIKGAISKVNETQVNANNKIESLIKGEDVSMHEVMLSVQESQMSMQLMLEARNKLYDAYQQLNSVQM